MSLSERLRRQRRGLVEITTPDGLQEIIHLKTLSFYEWNDIGFEVPYPDKERFMVSEKLLVKGQPTNEKKLDAEAYRRALNDFGETVSLYRLGAAVAGGGDVPDFVNMSHEARATELQAWDLSVVRALVDALEQISLKSRGEVQAENGNSFPNVSQDGAADLPADGLAAGDVAGLNYK